MGGVEIKWNRITDLKAHDWEPWTKLWLYTAVQTGSDRDALVQFSKREVPWEEVTLVDGHYVLKSLMSPLSSASSSPG